MITDGHVHKALVAPAGSVWADMAARGWSIRPAPEATAELLEQVFDDEAWERQQWRRDLEESRSEMYSRDMRDYIYIDSSEQLTLIGWLDRTRDAAYAAMDPPRIDYLGLDRYVDDIAHTLGLREMPVGR